MKLKTPSSVAEAKIDLVPMIDTVMFMLIFFMCTTTLRQKETDLGITLPGMVAQTEAVQMPDEQIVEVDGQGTVILNGTRFTGKEMPDLAGQLVRYRLSSEAARIPYMITVQAEDDAAYERLIDVMNACAAAGITNVTFGPG